MLQANSLSCRRSGREIFRDISFTLEPSAALLVTGANGSGKSSLLRLLAGLLEPAAGTIAWRGQDIAEDSDTYRKDIHYIGHLDAVKPELTVAEMLDYWRSLHCFPSARNLLPGDPFDILPLRDKTVRYLSAGQKRRLALSRVMLGNAALWLLDEPATALDKDGQDILLDCIATHRAKGGITVIATHHAMKLSGAARCELKGGRE